MLARRCRTSIESSRETSKHEEFTMYTAALMLVGQITDRQRELIAEAERYRLLAAARRRRRRERTGTGAEPAVQDRTTGTLAPCGPSVAAPAR
jgi:hypothetical protein